MWHSLKKFLVALLAVALAASTPVLSHARMATSHATASHELHVVQHYADLAVEPADDGCPHGSPPGTQDQDNAVCKKCCAACLGASLVPCSPVSVQVLSERSDLTAARAHILAERDIPTEPGIPKSL